jgi:hypothetical protein
MPEQSESPQERHSRYLRYAAEARELAARTTHTVKEHHLRVALAWEATARKLAPLLSNPKPKFLQTVSGTMQGPNDTDDGVRHVLGHRTEAVRTRLAHGLFHSRRRAEAVTQDSEDRPESIDDPSS